MVDEIIRLIEKNTTASIEADMSISDFIWQKYRGKGIGFKLAMQELI
jgi:predicted acetyltransferase